MPATPFDSVYVFFSGHGASTTGGYTLLPFDATVGHPDPNGRQHVSGGITATDLQMSFEAITARQTVLVFDACGAGDLVSSTETVPAPLNLGGFGRLALEKGMFVLAAATSRAAAMEGPPSGPGGTRSILSYVLVQEGLVEGKAETNLRDGMVDVEEWFGYAARHVPDVAQQHPTFFVPMQRDDSRRAVVGQVQR
jgi:uncharacterized caspase-like protein